MRLLLLAFFFALICAPASAQSKFEFARPFDFHLSGGMGLGSVGIGDGEVQSITPFALGMAFRVKYLIAGVDVTAAYGDAEPLDGFFFDSTVDRCRSRATGRFASDAACGTSDLISPYYGFVGGALPLPFQIVDGIDGYISGGIAYAALNDEGVMPWIGLRLPFVGGRDTKCSISVDAIGNSFIRGERTITTFGAALTLAFDGAKC